jgi:hypothetical protein
MGLDPWGFCLIGRSCAAVHATEPNNLISFGSKDLFFGVHLLPL